MSSGTAARGCTFRDFRTTDVTPSDVGYIPLENVIGRVGVMFFFIDPGSNGAQPAIRHDRIGAVVQ
jgi:signal peptidase I